MSPARGLPAAGTEPALPEDSTAWRRVHPATPLIDAWKVLTVLVAVLVLNSLDTVLDLISTIRATGTPLLVMALVVLGAAVAVLALALGYSWFAWRRMRYAVGDDAVYFHHGILFRQQRHARLNRIQGVDIVRPLLGRMVGLSAVSIETAGGSNANIRVQYLRDEEAERLRAEVLARAAGVVPRAERGQVPVFAQAPEREVYRLTLGDQVLSLLLSAEFLGTVLVMGGLLVSSAIFESWVGLFGMIPVLLAVGGFLVARFDGDFNHVLAVSPDGLRLRGGLLSTRAQTLPPGRVQAVAISQSLLWRTMGWWRVEVNVAGYAAKDPSSGQQRRTTLLPVARRANVLDALWLVLRDLGVDDVDAVLDAALTGTLADGGFLHSPRAARWVDPIRWRRNGLLITRTALFMREGELHRRVIVVPHERTQSLALQQGPWERRLGLADLVADSVPGPVRPRAAHLPAPVAGRLLLEQAARARHARAQEGPEEWMSRVGATP